MGGTKGRRHPHRYHFVAISPSTKVWACASPDCSHYMPTNMMNMIHGKQAECWECDNITTMSEERMEYAKKKNEGRILCEDCINRREGKYDTPKPEPALPPLKVAIGEANKKVKSILDEIEE